MWDAPLPFVAEINELPSKESQPPLVLREVGWPERRDERVHVWVPLVPLLFLEVICSDVVDGTTTGREDSGLFEAYGVRRVRVRVREEAGPRTLCEAHRSLARPWHRPCGLKRLQPELRKDRSRKFAQSPFRPVAEALVAHIRVPAVSLQFRLHVEAGNNPATILVREFQRRALFPARAAMRSWFLWLELLLRTRWRH